MDKNLFLKQIARLIHNFDARPEQAKIEFMFSELSKIMTDDGLRISTDSIIANSKYIQSGHLPKISIFTENCPKNELLENLKHKFVANLRTEAQERAFRLIKWIDSMFTLPIEELRLNKPKTSEKTNRFIDEYFQGWECLYEKMQVNSFFASSNLATIEKAYIDFFEKMAERYFDKKIEDPRFLLTKQDQNVFFIEQTKSLN